MDAAHVVGRRDEQHFGQVVVDVEVVVVERGILLRIKHFEESRSGISVEVLRHLVDLVEHDYGVRGPGPLDGLDDTTRHGTDVGLAVSADFRFVVQTAERNPAILTAQRPGDRFAERGFAHARRPVEAEDGRFHVALELEHGQVFDDALLDLFQTEVVLVQDFLGVLHVEIVLGEFVPGQFEEEVHVGVLDVVIG